MGRKREVYVNDTQTRGKRKMDDPRYGGPATPSMGAPVRMEPRNRETLPEVDSSNIFLWMVYCKIMCGFGLFDNQYSKNLDGLIKEQERKRGGSN